MSFQLEVEKCVAGVLAGRRYDIGRAISGVENRTDIGLAILRAIREYLGHAHVIGVTGPGGAGKSTLVSAMIGELRTRNQKIGVVAVDPSSPVSGGALLGDRIRMLEHATSDSVFIRSVASRGHSGGLSLAASSVVDILDASGMDTVIVETLGAGQAEVDVCRIVDTKVVVCPPGLGDEIQAMKAGILEMADVLVVNKADLRQAELLVQSLLNMLSLRPQSARRVPLIRTVATTGDGVRSLIEVIISHASVAGTGLRHKGSMSRLREMLGHLTGDECRRQIMSDENEEMNLLCSSLEATEIGYDEALVKVFELIAKRVSAR